MNHCIRTTLTLIALGAICLYGFTTSTQAQVVDIPGDMEEETATYAATAAKPPLAKITQPGLYRLTKNLKTTYPDQTGIQVLVGDVTIDLNGYAIMGPAVCTQGVCTHTGSGAGVYADFAALNVTVMNGIVLGMGSSGIMLGSGRVDRVTAKSNGGDGVYVSSGMVSNSISSNNGLNGIRCPTVAVILGNYVSVNGAYGIVANNMSGYANNVLYGNIVGDVGTSSSLRPRAMGGNVCTGVPCPE